MTGVMSPESLQRAALEWLGARPGAADSPDTKAATSAAAAVFSFVDALPSVRRTGPEPGAWTPDTIQGAVMLTARITRRRNSPAGIEAFTTDGAAYVSRADSDVAQLLRLGSYGVPRIG